VTLPEMFAAWMAPASVAVKRTLLRTRLLLSVELTLAAAGTVTVGDGDAAR
jgi:hypothetical protein